MNAHALVRRHPHGLIAFQRAHLPSAFFREVKAFAAFQFRMWPHGIVAKWTRANGQPRPIANAPGAFRSVRQRLFSALNPALRNAMGLGAITWRLPITTKTGVSVLLAGMAGAIAMLA